MEDKETKNYIVILVILAVIITSIYGLYRYKRKKEIAYVFEYCLNHDYILSRNTQKMESLLKKYPELTTIEHPQLGRLIYYVTTKEMAELLIQYGADVNVKQGDGQTPLHCMAYEWRLEMVKVLISKGVDVNAKDNDSKTPLHCLLERTIPASQYGVQVVELLIQYGVDVNAKDKWGHTPLYYAIKGGHTEIADLLRKHGAKE